MVGHDPTHGVGRPNHIPRRDYIVHGVAECAITDDEVVCRAHDYSVVPLGDVIVLDTVATAGGPDQCAAAAVGGTVALFGRHQGSNADPNSVQRVILHSAAAYD